MKNLEKPSYLLKEKYVALANVPIFDFGDNPSNVAQITTEMGPNLLFITESNIPHHIPPEFVFLS